MRKYLISLIVSFNEKMISFRMIDFNVYLHKWNLLAWFIWHEIVPSPKTEIRCGLFDKKKQ